LASWICLLELCLYHLEDITVSSSSDKDSYTIFISNINVKNLRRRLVSNTSLKCAFDKKHEIITTNSNFGNYYCSKLARKLGTLFPLENQLFTSNKLDCIIAYEHSYFLFMFTPIYEIIFKFINGKNCLNSKKSIYTPPPLFMCPWVKLRTLCSGWWNGQGVLEYIVGGSGCTLLSVLCQYSVLICAEQDQCSARGYVYVIVIVCIVLVVVGHSIVNCYYSAPSDDNVLCFVRYIALTDALKYWRKILNCNQLTYSSALVFLYLALFLFIFVLVVVWHCLVNCYYSAPSDDNVICFVRYIALTDELKYWRKILNCNQLTYSSALVFLYLALFLFIRTLSKTLTGSLNFHTEQGEMMIMMMLGYVDCSCCTYIILSFTLLKSVALIISEPSPLTVAVLGTPLLFTSLWWDLCLLGQPPVVSSLARSLSTKWQVLI